MEWINDGEPIEEHLHRARVMLLSKTDGTDPPLNKIRLIAMLSHIFKMYEATYDRMTSWPIWNTIDEDQRGFRKGHGVPS